MFLARKITQAKWRPKEGFAEGEIAADAVTVDLKTQNNSLSFWRCPTETTEDLEKAVLAIAATRNRVEKLEIVWLINDDLQNDCQTLENTEGDTPVSELKELHVDVCDWIRPPWEGREPHCYCVGKLSVASDFKRTSQEALGRGGDAKTGRTC